MQDVFLVKLGGGLITDKSKPEALRKQVLERLCREVHEARLEAGLTLVVGHGGGSFPHQPAHDYSVQKGVMGADSLTGISLVQDAASRLNRFVVRAFLDAGEQAVSIQPSASLYTRKGRVVDWYTKPLEMALDQGMLPVPYGDVVFDSEIGCSIVSTEVLLGVLARKLKSKKLFIVTQEDGVFADFPKKEELIQEITPANFESLKPSLGGSHGKDVTGGMLHKVERMLEIAESGAEIKIINGLVEGRLKKALLGEDVPGTLVRV